MERLILIALLFAGSAGRYQAQGTLAGTGAPWKSFGEPMSARQCAMVMRVAHERPTVYLSGVPYRRLVRCVEI
jgi:hypothetical protein